MESNTSPRRGRPRKVVDVPNIAQEGADATANHPGDGQAGATGLATPAVDPGQGTGLDGFVTRLLAAHVRSGFAIRSAYHPASDGRIAFHENGSIPVFVGDEAAFDGNGKLIEI